MSAAQPTRGRLNMQPPGLNSYASPSCTENARTCREGYVRTTVGRFTRSGRRGDVPAQLACAHMSYAGSWRVAIRRRLELSAAER